MRRFFPPTITTDVPGLIPKIDLNFRKCASRVASQLSWSFINGFTSASVQVQRTLLVEALPVHKVRTKLTDNGAKPCQRDHQGVVSPSRYLSTGSWAIIRLKARLSVRFCTGIDALERELDLVMHS